MAKKAQDIQYFMGIEATSRTVALLADAHGDVLGEGTASSAVYSVVGQERSDRALWTAVLGAYKSAGFNARDMTGVSTTLPQVEAVCVGMSGVERPKDEGHIRRILTTYNLFGKMIITNDAHIVLESACQFEMERPGYGLAIMSGENGFVYAKGQDGQIARAGGWGYLLGDEGSAYRIGFTAVQAVLQAADGRGQETSLTGLIEQEWKLPANRPDSLLQRFNGLLAGLGTGGNKAQYEDTIEVYKKTLSSLVPLIERAAANEDVVAGNILDQTADDLQKAAQAVIKRTNLANIVPTFKVAGLDFQLKSEVVQPKIPLAFHGSVLLSSAGQLRQRLQAKLPECDEPLAIMQPAEGALKLALLAGTTK